MIIAPIEDNYVDFNQASANDRCYNELNEADECEIGQANQKKPYLDIIKKIKI